MSYGAPETMTDPPTSTLPPGGVWQPPQIPSLGGDKQLVSPYTYAPIVIESSLTFKTLSADWAVTNRGPIEGTIKATLGLSAYEEVKITRIMSLTTNQGMSDGYGLGGSGAGGSSFGSITRFFPKSSSSHLHASFHVCLDSISDVSVPRIFVVYLVRSV